MAGCYWTLLTAARYGRMRTNAVTKSSLLSKSLLTPPLAIDHPAPCYLNSGEIIFIIFCHRYRSPKRDSNLGLNRIAIFEDCKASALTTQATQLVICPYLSSTKIIHAIWWDIKSSRAKFWQILKQCFPSLYVAPLLPHDKEWQLDPQPSKVAEYPPTLYLVFG